nr:MAG: hypothetical protein [Microvirus sp.]
MKKKTSKKTKEILIGILVAVGSYVAGVVSVENPKAGKIIETVVDVIGSSNKDSTNVTWEQNY